MQLARAALVIVILAASAGPARADGALMLRGFYYKERSTRVQQPALDGRFDVGDDGELGVHFLVDAITSASVASGAAGEAFTEFRWEAGGRYSHQIDIVRVGTNVRFSREPDYTSLFAGVRGELELADKNTVLGLAFNAGRDELSNAGAQGGIMAPLEGSLTTLMGSASVSQILSPTVLVGATYDLIHLDGFQESPYRTVVAGGFAEMERVPEKRWRHALAGSVRGFLPASKTTLYAGYRLYLDDWGITAHTPEVRLIQELPREVEAALRFRYHRQSRADFFKTIYDSNDPDVEPFLTDDPKLSAFDGQTYGFKIDAPLGAFGVSDPERARIRAMAIAEYVVQNNRFGDAVVLVLGVTVPFDY